MIPNLPSVFLYWVKLFQYELLPLTGLYASPHGTIKPFLKDDSPTQCNVSGLSLLRSTKAKERQSSSVLKTFVELKIFTQSFWLN